MTGVRALRVPTSADQGVGARWPWLVAAATVGCQMAFPFTGGGTPALTIVTVVLFAVTCVGHALVRLGAAAAAALLLVAGGIGLLAEAIGVRTGLPFGRYEYAGTLGPQLLGVPAVVPLAWLMMAYPALIAGRVLAGSATAGRLLAGSATAGRLLAGSATAGRLLAGSATAGRLLAGSATAGRLLAGRFTTGPLGARIVTIVVGAWGLASWDVFLDPQMVDAGHWRWLDPVPSLPGVDGIPVTNFAGWLLVALVLIALLDAVLPAVSAGAARLPVALYLWTYGSSVLAHLAFFGRPSVALAGGVAMGLVAVPLAVTTVRGHR